jgi:Protein of unknown function (DUF3107)
VDVRIGVTHAKEIELELSEDVDRDQLVKQIEAAVNDGDGMLWLTDRKGRQVGVPAGKVAYVELSPAHEDRRVGFGTV